MGILSKSSKIAITGGAGYIGSFTVNFLKSLGFNEIVILDDYSTGQRDKTFSKVYEVNLLDKNNLNDIFQKERFEAVIHFAALALVPLSMADPFLYFHHNINTSLNLLEVMRVNSVRNIIFSSSCSVYGTPEKLPLLESDRLKPESVYAETKAMIEKIIIWYSKIFDIKYSILRYFNACGAAPDGSNGEIHDPETHLIPSAIKKVLEGKTIEIYGNDYPTPDKTCIRDYIHVDDLASAHHLALSHLIETGQSDIFNLGVGHGCSNLEVVSAVIKAAAKNGIDAKYIFKPRRAGDVSALYSSNAKAKEILSWSPKHINIEEIVEAAFNFHKKNFNV